MYQLYEIFEKDYRSEDWSETEYTDSKGTSGVFTSQKSKCSNNAT